MSVRVSISKLACTCVPKNDLKATGEIIASEDEIDGLEINSEQSVRLTV